MLFADKHIVLSSYRWRCRGIGQHPPSADHDDLECESTHSGWPCGCPFGLQRAYEGEASHELQIACT